MKICFAQTRPAIGNINSNIKNHVQFINVALEYNAGMIIFPELSLTGYEPALAKKVATRIDDNRLDIFQEISDQSSIAIAVGLPIKHDTGITISIILFQPDTPRLLYSKKYIHPDEEPFFISGENYSGTISNRHDIAMAICYELSVIEHAELAYQRNARIYIASVAKSFTGVEQAYKRLREIARQYTMITIMVNSVGYCDNFESAGQSAAWNSKGELLGQLNSNDSGILILDTEKQSIIQRKI